MFDAAGWEGSAATGCSRRFTCIPLQSELLTVTGADGVIGTFNSNYLVRFLNQQSRCFISWGRCSCWQESSPNIMVWLVAVDYSRSPLPLHPLLSPGRGPYWVTASCTSFRRSAPTNQTSLTWVTKEGVRGLKGTSAFLMTEERCFLYPVCAKVFFKGLPRAKVTQPLHRSLQLNSQIRGIKHAKLRAFYTRALPVAG